MPEHDPTQSPEQSRIGAMLVGVKEAFSNGVETLQTGLENLKQNTNRIRLIGEVASMGFGLAIGLTSVASAEEPLRTPNVPVAEAGTSSGLATTSAEATTSDAQQDCVDAALARPKPIGGPNRKYGGMVYPGDRRKQSTFTGGSLEPISADCLPLINRETPQIFFKMQRPKNHKAYIRTRSQPMTDGSNNPVDGNSGGKGGASVTASGKGGIRAAHFLYRCTPSKGITHVRAVYKLKVDSAIDGSELGHRSISVPIKIIPIPSSMVQGGGVAKAC